jgi:hypothetical protein
MSNYNKSFNFRNGVQVDDSHFIVNSSGLVGIGTSLPTQLLDVSGNINASGLVQTNNLKTLGISTLAETRVGIGITLDPTTGIITANYFYGNGSTLSYLPTSQWINIDVGFGYTSIYAQGNVGVATNDPRYALQIGGRPDITGQAGVGINSSGGMIVTGVVTSYSGFSGPGLGITQLNANYLVVGSISTTRLPIIPNALIPIYISAGIVTASSGFVGNLTGNVSGNINGNYVQAGIVTATNIFQGSLAGAAITATYITAGIITTTGNGVYGSLFGPVFGNVIGALTGVADSARNLTGGPNIYVNNAFTTSITNEGNLITGFTSITSNLRVGSGGLTLATTNGFVGIGTTQPTTSNLQVRNSSDVVVEVISNNASATLSIGNSVGLGNSSGLLRYGATYGDFDIINQSTGNLNYYIHNGSAGIDTGSFIWKYGQYGTRLMNLTYQGLLGIGNPAPSSPTNTLHVVGTSTVTGNSYVGQNQYVNGALYIGFGANQISIGAGATIILSNTNVLNASGISTFAGLTVNGTTTTQRLGVGSNFYGGVNSSVPLTDLDVSQGTAYINRLGVSTTVIRSGAVLDVNGVTLVRGVGIGTTSTTINNDTFDFYLTTGGASGAGGAGAIRIDNTTTKFNICNIHADTSTIVGIGSTTPRCVLDFSFAGQAGTPSAPGEYRNFMLPPILTTTQRNALTGVVAGAMIYNSTTNKHQGYNGSTWNDFY